MGKGNEPLSFSIIIPTFNPGKSFDKLLFSIIKQKGNIKEIIVIDSSSSDSTISIAKKYSATTIIVPQSEFDHGRTRNLAAQNATGELLMFITQDIDPLNDQLLVEFSSAFQDAHTGGAFARQLPQEGANDSERLWRLFNYPPSDRTNSISDIKSSGMKAVFFSNSCSCIRKEVFINVGGFPNKIICGEDFIIAFKILKYGYKTKYLSRALVRHSHRYSLAATFNRYFDIGVLFISFPELKECTSNSNDGFTQTLSGIIHLIKNKHWLSIPHFALESFIKFLGYWAGINYTVIPNKLRPILSRNKSFWLDSRPI